MSMRNVLSALQDNTLLAKGLSFNTIASLIDALAWFRPQIALSQPSYETSPPSALPDCFVIFLRDSFDIRGDDVETLWCHLRNVIWAQPVGIKPSDVLLAHILEHGPASKLSACSFFLPLLSWAERPF
jgi:hypothetical protein